MKILKNINNRTEVNIQLSNKYFYNYVTQQHNYPLVTLLGFISPDQPYLLYFCFNRRGLYSALDWGYTRFLYKNVTATKLMSKCNIFVVMYIGVYVVVYFRECVKSMDPYCVFSCKQQQCVSVYNVNMRFVCLFVEYFHVCLLVYLILVVTIFSTIILQEFYGPVPIYTGFLLVRK